LSFKVKEACEHWRREIKQAFETGKTVVVFMPPVQEFFIATGERQFSGTGRNRQTTRVVKIYSNFNAIPPSQVPVNGNCSRLFFDCNFGEVVWKFDRRIRS
jgi:hypothetical protein